MLVEPSPDQLYVRRSATVAVTVLSTQMDWQPRWTQATLLCRRSWTPLTLTKEVSRDHRTTRSCSVYTVGECLQRCGRTKCWWRNFLQQLVTDCCSIKLSIGWRQATHVLRTWLATTSVVRVMTGEGSLSIDSSTVSAKILPNIWHMRQPKTIRTKLSGVRSKNYRAQRDCMASRFHT